MHVLVLLCVNQYTKFEVPSFTNYKGMIGAKLTSSLAVADKPARRAASRQTAKL